jgi:hypothetical protein
MGDAFFQAQAVVVPHITGLTASVAKFFLRNNWIIKAFYYLCSVIQVKIFNVSEIRSLFVYQGLDFFFVGLIVKW